MQWVVKDIKMLVVKDIKIKMWVGKDINIKMQWVGKVTEIPAVLSTGRKRPVHHCQAC